MSSTILSEAASLLRAHYGTPTPPVAPGEWLTLAKLVAGRGVAPQKLNTHWPELAESVLSSAQETQGCGAAELKELLLKLGHAGRSAPVLKSLARWWVERVERSDIPSRPLDALREELRQLPGVGHELADRILLEVFELPAYPLDRASVRIACRHGWLGLESEYDEWQAFFVQGLADIPLAEFSAWCAAVGREYCGPKPKCESCPLRSLLPPGGPYEFEGD